MKDALAALATTPNPRDTFFAAWALAMARQDERAQRVISDQAKRVAENTFVQSLNVPTIQAACEMNRGDSARAIETLRTAIPYDRAIPAVRLVRGTAYLRAGRGAEAVQEFQSVLAMRYLLPLQPLGCLGGALAQLGLARAYALSGDKAKTRAAYQDFFSLWKDADLDIPILKEAKAEYAKLQ